MLIFARGPLRGTIGVPGDKSISHRALVLGAACDAPLHISNLNPGRDVRATLDALRALGTRIEHAEPDGATIVHPSALTRPDRIIDCMNSGSTARMLLGVCAGAGVAAQFDGDQSLRRRPMEPVAAQLRAFGARIETSDGRLPLRILGRPEIETRRFILLSPSAQVKSALLFAGLFGKTEVRVDGDRGSRDHTERLLSFLGAPIEWDRRSVTLRPAALRAMPVQVAGDFSAAAFFITAAAITPGSAIVIRQAGVNPTRIGLLDALERMGAGIELRNARTLCGEPVAEIAVEHRPLQAATIEAELALRAIDELPLIAAAAAFARGTTRIGGIDPLRGKESDRVAAIERLLDAVGIEAHTERHTLAITGGTPTPQGVPIATHDDHRTVMAAAVLACAAGPLQVDAHESIDVSFPGFAEALEGLRKA